MFQFNVNDISKYRTQLMGIATLLVIFGHSVGNGVVMPRWMESLCGLASVGVDIFLLVSGLGLWYSLKSIDSQVNLWGVKCWYIRRYKRILVPYFIIAGIGNILAVMGGRTIGKLYLIYPQSVIGLNIKELGILQCLYRCMLLPRFMMRYVKR